ncbi:cache domain-containing sensor histidine kinase [Anaeromassilibacillus senegalensis]|uniref:cache domain-containing sensor histidine kinase n=1 Tax=Anaeromassilibacillus senegalensis TaxID=1673717 RepID=UPI00068367F5|nr:sensor histidine kinase [Anaeromassilibacillus senegalensis]
MRQKWKRFRRAIARNMKWNSLLMVIAVSTTVIAVTAVLAITLLMKNRFDAATDETIRMTNAQIVDNLRQNIDGYLSEMVEVSDSVAAMLQDGGIREEAPRFVLRRDIDTIAVFGREGELLLKTDARPIKSYAQIKEEQWFRSVPPGSKNYYISAPHVQRLYGGEYPWVLSLSKGVNWQEDGRTQMGIILVDMNFQSIQQLCSNRLGQGGYLFILDENGELIYHPNQQMIYYGIADEAVERAASIGPGDTILDLGNKRFSVSVRGLSGTNWRIVGVSPLQGLFYYGTELPNLITMIAVAAALIVLVLSVVVSYFTTNPIRRLIRVMGKVEDGSLDAFSTEHGVYEVQELSRSFNNMIYRIRHLMVQVVEEQQRLRKSEMKTLHAQINPHFLYNTLDSIVWMAESGDNANVVKMISALAQFFRLSLSGGHDTITVEEELRHAENYLIIQKMRYSDQFTYTIDAPPEIRTCKTLKIVLQPLVENAILHGVSNLPYPGEIRVNAEVRDGKLLFVVCDNGFGIPPDKLAHILESKAKSKSGIGVKNVNDRIQLLFGREYGLQYESELDEGTTVRVWLPLAGEEEGTVTRE